MKIMSNYDVFFYIIWGMVTDLPHPLPHSTLNEKIELLSFPFVSETTEETSR